MHAWDTGSIWLHQKETCYGYRTLGTWEWWCSPCISMYSLPVRGTSMTANVWNVSQTDHLSLSLSPFLAASLSFPLSHSWSCSHFLPFSLPSQCSECSRKIIRLCCARIALHWGADNMFWKEPRLKDLVVTRDLTSCRCSQQAEERCGTSRGEEQRPCSQQHHALGRGGVWEPAGGNAHHGQVGSNLQRQEDQVSHLRWGGPVLRVWKRGMCVCWGLWVLPYNVTYNSVFLFKRTLFCSSKHAFQYLELIHYL